MADKPELDELWKRWRKTKGEDSREALLTAYVPLVKRIFSRVRVGLPDSASAALHQDLVQSGVLGLIQAFEHYSPKEGVEFGAFASFRIRGAMLDELRRQDWLSKNCRRRLKEIQAAYAALDQKLGRHASDEEVAKQLGLSTNQLHQELVEIGPATLVFLEGLGGDGEHGPWESYLKDPHSSNPEDQAQRRELMGQLAGAIEKLPGQERQVLTWLIYKELGQKEIAEVMGVTPSRVSQIYAKAVIRLRAALAPAGDHVGKP